MKNLTITLEEQVYRKLKEKADQENVSMSRFVSRILERDLTRSPEEQARELMEALRRAAESAQNPEPLKWNRDEIYEH